MTKMGQKLIKMAQKVRCFCTFSVFVLLKFHLAGSRGGARAPVPHSWRRQCPTECYGIVSSIGGLME